MPAGCSYHVRTTAATVLNRMGDTTTFGASPTPQNVHVTWASDPSNSAAILWATDVATLATVVEYGTDMTALGSMAVGHTTSSSAGATGAHMHEVHICGLMPDTTYYYRAGGEGHWSAVQRFRTAPAAGGSGYDVNFAVAGDTRDNFSLWTMVQSQILAMSGATTPDFLLFSGDAIPLGTDQNAWNQWFTASSGTMSQMPFVFAHGNHEALSLNYLVQIAQPQTGNAESDELYYSFDYGPIHIVVLNDSPALGDVAGVVGGSERTWLMNDLAAVNRTRTPWVVAFHHKGAFSSSNHTSDADIAIVRSSWPPVYAQNGVDVVFNGHDHNFEVTQPWVGVGTRAPRGVGGGGFTPRRQRGRSRFGRHFQVGKPEERSFDGVAFRRRLRTCDHRQRTMTRLDRDRCHPVLLSVDQHALRWVTYDRHVRRRERADVVASRRLMRPARPIEMNAGRNRFRDRIGRHDCDVDAAIITE